MSHLLHELIARSAAQAPDAPALGYGDELLTYGELNARIAAMAAACRSLGLGRGERLAVYAEKRIETVVAIFGTAAAGCVFVPVNPVLKGQQVAHILADCNVRVLVTTAERLAIIAPDIERCTDLRGAVLIGREDAPAALAQRLTLQRWDDLLAGAGTAEGRRVIDTDMAAILYTSGSTGKPKGVVLSHRNMVAGAKSVTQYLQNGPHDRILSALPLSFDAGFSQLSTAFHSGASVYLLNFLFARDVMRALEKHRITGLTAVPPLWIQLAPLAWPPAAVEHLRYIANTGGKMPKTTLERLRAGLPRTQVFLMYGLTESFRSTYLPPSELERRPDSIGKAIPNAEVLVVRPDGTPCDADEPGELVHRGALVSLGYWNDLEKTAERFKPAPGQPSGLVIPEIAVWSGDTVRRDSEGFLYFIGRRDEMIKTSGYRVSPTEIEEVIYATGLVGEVAALGLPHAELGQAVAVVVTPREGKPVDADALLAECRRRLPAYMVPARVLPREASLPRNPNGKIDRKSLAEGMQDLFGAGA
ncbi:MAG: acyl-CoA ligase (AMP-forming), exosortase A system-associated [Betaproteobacteria bacterium]